MLKFATGIPALENIPEESIVDRTIKIGFFNRKTNKLIGGTTFLPADCKASEPDEWNFKKTKGVPPQGRVQVD